MYLPQWNQVLQSLEKAVDTDTLADLVPEDLEIEAHSFLWNETDPGELTLLKLLPHHPATSIAHQYNRVTSYGASRNTGFFSEKSLPPESNFSTDRVVNNIRLMGDVGPTYLLAGLEKTAKALGTSGAAEIERIALRRLTLWRKNRNLYFSRTDTHRLGIPGPRFKGLRQLIEEGTNGVTGTSPYGSHVVDFEGEQFSIDTLRQKAAQAITLHGMFNELIMDPFVRGDLEGSMDSSQRLPLPITASPYTIGQEIAGFRTQGGIITFSTDNTLSPIHAFGQYGEMAAELAEGSPITRPTGTASAGAGAATSKWDAASAGEMYYVVTEVVDELEGLGTRIPASPTYLSVAAGQRVTLTITPGNPLASSFKVYRGTENDETDTSDAWFIFEQANTGGGAAVVFYDDNLERPNTSTAFALRLVSASRDALNAPTPTRYYDARDRAASFLSQPDSPRNTIAVAELGPRMGMMQLATILPTIDRPLIYTACSPEVRNPRQNWVFKNIGRGS